MTRVTIVTPSYNQAPFLEETILSVIGQDHPDLEYIVIDGGSTDGSVDIIRKYEAHLAYWVSERDKGQSDAINKGMALATGSILTWLNSDDILLAGAVSKMVRAFDALPKAGLVYADAVNTDANGDVLGPRFGRPYSLGAMLVDNLVPQPAGFFTKSAWDVCGPLDMSYHYVMDRVLWLCMGRHFEIVYEPGMVATMRRHPDAKTQYGRVATKLEELRVLDEYYGADIPAEAVIARAGAYGRLHYYLGLFYLAEADYEKATEHLTAALEVDPRHRRNLVVAALLASARMRTPVLAQTYPKVMETLVKWRLRFASQ